MGMNMTYMFGLLVMTRILVFLKERQAFGMLAQLELFGGLEPRAVSLSSRKRQHPQSGPKL